MGFDLIWIYWFVLAKNDGVIEIFNLLKWALKVMLNLKAFQGNGFFECHGFIWWKLMGLWIFMF